MKWLLAALVAIAGLAGYGYFYPEQLPGWARAHLPISATKPEPAASTTLYKWRDAQGHWQIADTPPTEGAYEKVDIRHDTNVMPGERLTD